MFTASGRARGAPNDQAGTGREGISAPVKITRDLQIALHIQGSAGACVVDPNTVAALGDHGAFQGVTVLKERKAIGGSRTGQAVFAASAATDGVWDAQRQAGAADTPHDVPSGAGLSAQREVGTAVGGAAASLTARGLAHGHSGRSHSCHDISGVAGLPAEREIQPRVTITRTALRKAEGIDAGHERAGATGLSASREAGQTVHGVCVSRCVSAVLCVGRVGGASQSDALHLGVAPNGNAQP